MKRTPSNSQILREWNNGCRKKLAFNSLDYTLIQMQRLQQKYNKEFTFYICPTCYKYHLTTVKT